jgi:hypothetical protein
MEITPDHPVYVEGKGWLGAENLAIGDRLRRADGGWAKVLAVERVRLAEPKQVYNFTVKGPHTYFVLEAGVLVHNDACHWFGEQGESTVYRFANNEQEATTSRFGFVTEDEQPVKKVVQKDIISEPPGSEYYKDSAYQHARSLPNDDGFNPRNASPFIATTDNIANAARTSDHVSLQGIIYGTNTRGVQSPEEATKFIYELSAPNKLLYQPQIKDLSLEEGEKLILDIWSVDQPLKWDVGNLPSQLKPTRVFPNPFAGTDIKYVQSVLNELKKANLLNKMDVETTIALIEHIKTTRIDPAEARAWVLKRY